MATINSGFAGTVNDVQAAKASGIADLDAVASASAWRVVQGVGRQVQATIGDAFAKGVLTELTTPITVALTTPTNGQWNLIVRRIDWQAKSVTLVAVPGATTPNAAPTDTPAVYPAIETTPGVKYDHVLGWVWTNSVNTDLIFADLRQLPLTARIGDFTPTVADTAERLAVFPFPKQGASVKRADNGNRIERYWGKYDPTTNPAGRQEPGWYPDGKIVTEFFAVNYIIEDAKTGDAARVPKFAIDQGNSPAGAEKLYTIPDAPGTIILRNPGFYTWHFRASLEYSGQARAFSDVQVGNRLFRGEGPNAGEQISNFSHRLNQSADVSLVARIYMAGQRRVVFDPRLILTYEPFTGPVSL